MTITAEQATHLGNSLSSLSTGLTKLAEAVSHLEKLVKDAVAEEESPVASPGPDKKRKRAKKDPNAPKIPMSSYLCYSRSARAQIKQEHPEMPNGDIVKEMGRRWKLLTEKEREVFSTHLINI